MIFGESRDGLLSEFEQKRFLSIMNILLLGKKPELGDKSVLPNLNRKTRKFIGNQILKYYVDFFLSFQDLNFEKYARPDLTVKGREEVIEWIDKARTDITQMIAGKRERNEEFLRDIFDKIEILSGGFSTNYKELCFAPGISEKFMGFNCFGLTQVIGALLLRAGFDVKMAIAVNHPFCLIELGAKTFLLSNFGIKTVDTNKIRVDNKVPYFLDLREIDKTDEFDIVERVMVVTDFAEGVLYEYLENLAALKNKELRRGAMSLMVNTLYHDRTVAIMHRDLVGGDWQSIQGKIFPDIRKVFNAHSKDYVEEYRKMRKRYRDMFLSKALNSFFKDYFDYSFTKDSKIHSVYHWDKFIREKKSDMREAMVNYSDEVIDYVKNGKTFNANVPVFFTNFIYCMVGWIREVQNEELSHDLLEKFLNPIYEAKEKLEAVKRVEEAISKPIGKPNS